MKIDSKDFRVLKDVLHLSKDEQRPCEEFLSTASTKIAPRYVAPADDKENARLIISQVILDTLDELKMRYPKPGKGHRKELQSIRNLLAK